MINHLAFDRTLGNEPAQGSSKTPPRTNLPTHQLEKKLRRNVGRAIEDYNMIEEGDRIMVCVSGGKDSFTLLDLLTRLRTRAPVKFDLLAVNLDQQQPRFPAAKLEAYLASTGIDYRMVQRDTYSVVKRVIPEGKTMCGLCSRLRRGVLYTVASLEGITKIALGHHLDDIVETLFLNMFYGATLKAMPPKLLNDSGEHVVIRPLAYCRERDISRYAHARRFPLIPCDLCGSQPNLQRQVIKQMLSEWEKTHPGRTENIFRSLTKIAPSQLADRALFDFAGLGAGNLPETWLPEGASRRNLTKESYSEQP
ncbi:MAG: tRNA 2-thiocytidine(32) synthetase TtcA [Pseudomonadota bacterium]|nr:tRNA 2-thiocytidine(32) synthetase TtcA [Pseudomonadota bacterium]